MERLSASERAHGLSIISSRSSVKAGLEHQMPKGDCLTPSLYSARVWYWVWSESCSVVSDCLWPHRLDSPWNSPGQNARVGSLSLLQDLPNPGIKPRSPALQADSLPAESPGKPKNTGVGSLSLLQWIFPTQELNWGLLHWQITLYEVLSGHNIKQNWYLIDIYIPYAKEQ